MSEPPAPRLSAADIQTHFDGSPFMRFLGLRVTAVDHDRAELSVTMPMRPEIERGVGTAQFHGGPIAAFIDCVGDFAVALVVGGGVPTINIPHRLLEARGRHINYGNRACAPVRTHGDGRRHRRARRGRGPGCRRARHVLESARLSLSITE